MEKTIFRLEITAEEQYSDLITGVLALNYPYGWEEASLNDGRVRFTLHTDLPENLDILPPEIKRVAPDAEIECTELEDKDWTSAWRQFFTPVPCGSRFMVIPPWLRDEMDLQGRRAIVIEPASAFGTGHHASTELCLSLISDLMDTGKLKPGMEFMDLGTGSGILGIALAGHGLTGLGIDIEAVAVANARENMELNGTTGMEVRQGDITAAEGRKFDIVVANILADVLKNLAPQLVGSLRPGGILLLSGILDIQAGAVEEKYMALGLPQAQRKKQGEWTALKWVN